MQKQQVKLLDSVRNKILLKHYSIRTEKALEKKKMKYLEIEI